MILIATLSFFAFCSIIRWTVDLLISDIAVDEGASYLLFGVGLVSVPIAAIIGVNLLIN
ncbi:MAG: hypothetical protein WC742_14330 [Gallionellaceae bacterium]